MSVIKHLIDKIVFTIGVIVFLQLPHFIDQYTQRIGGYAESKNQELNNYLNIANNNFGGDLEALINNFKSSNDLAVRQTGDTISNINYEVIALEDEIQNLESNSIFYRTLSFIKNIRMDLFKGTLQSFQPGIPLNLWAIFYGLLGGILFSIIFNTCVLIPKKLMQRKSKSVFA